MRRLEGSIRAAGLKGADGSMCFVHVLLNALDMYEKGMDGKIVVEGEATRPIPELEGPDNLLNGLYAKTKGTDLIDGARKACSAKMGIGRDRKARSSGRIRYVRARTACRDTCPRAMRS